MSGGANIVEQYAGADVPARIELLIKYYPNFIRLVEGYEQSLSFIIKEEKAYARKSAMEAIQKGNLESVTSELDECLFVCRDSLHLSRQQFLWQRVYLMYSCNGVEIESVEVYILFIHTMYF